MGSTSFLSSYVDGPLIFCPGRLGEDITSFLQEGQIRHGDPGSHTVSPSATVLHPEEREPGTQATI